MSGEASYVTLTEVANRTGVRLSAVSNWRTRYADFPTSQVVAGQEVFEPSEVVAWLRKRKIPRNRLASGEPVGTSYGERFLRNARVSGPSTAPTSTHKPQPREPTWGERLWAAVAVLRDTHDTASSLEFLLGLVYVKKCRTDVWQSLVGASNWPEMRDILAKVSLPMGTRGSPVRVFGKVSSGADQSLAEAVHLIDHIDFARSDGGQSIAAELSETILADLERGMGRGGGRFTPPDVARCVVELLDPRPSDRVYDPFCGSGELLAAAAAHVGRQSRTPSNWQVYGQTPQEWSWLTSTMNLALHDVKADLGTPAYALQEDRFPGLGFSMILANPPFNQPMALRGDQVWPFGEPPARNANFAWLQHVVDKLDPGGRAAVIMANEAASVSAEKELTIRRAMVEAGTVECVIALPRRLFRFTNVATMVWILRGTGAIPILRETLLIDARDVGVMADRTKRRLDVDDVGRIVGEYRRWRRNPGTFTGADGFSRAVGHNELSKHGYVLTPGRYTGSHTTRAAAVQTCTELSGLREQFDSFIQDAEEAHAALDARLAELVAGHRPSGEGHTVQLGTVCEVLPGPGSVRRSGRQPNRTPLVLPRNIKDDRIRDDDLDSVPPDTAASMARYRLIPGDIVTARAGTLGRYGLVLEEQTGWLLGPGCVRFRPGDQVNSDFLIGYLASPAARRWLMDHATGSAIQHVNAATLREMPIWLPPLPVQRAVLDVLSPLHTVAAMHSRISAVTQELHDLLVPMLMSPSTAREVE